MVALSESPTISSRGPETGFGEPRSDVLETDFPVAFLALLGALAARAGGAGVTMGAIRVTFWGAMAMALTAGVGALFGTVA